MSILTFLAAFKCEANSNGISEDMAKLVVPYVLSDNACLAYESALHLDAVDDSLVGIKSLLEAIQ